MEIRPRSGRSYWCGCGWARRIRKDRLEWSDGDRHLVFGEEVGGLKIIRRIITLGLAAKRMIGRGTYAAGMAMIDPIPMKNGNDMRGWGDTCDLAQPPGSIRLVGRRGCPEVDGVIQSIDGSRGRVEFTGQGKLETAAGLCSRETRAGGLHLRKMIRCIARLLGGTCRTKRGRRVG